MSHVINVGRMQLINRWVFIGIPLMVMGSALAIVILIGALLVPGSDPFYTGAGQAALWYFVVAGIQALTLTFPFSQGLSITRRHYFLGTTGTFALVALAFATLFFLLGLVEKATDGWFVHGYVFALPWVTDGPWYGTMLLVWSVSFLLFLIGLWMATIYKRWGVTGPTVASIAFSVLLLAIATVITLTHSWGDFGRWAAAQTPLSVSGGVAIVIALLLGGSFLTLRRAVP
jgi:hypothetical protein